MSAQFRILSDYGLVYVQYSGLARVKDGFAAFSAYLQHPDCRPGQRHLVDLTDVTEVENDFPSLFEFQADKAAAFMASDEPVMMVYLAPTDTSLKMARAIQRSWEGLDGAIIRIAIDWPGAMDILGLPRDALDAVIVRDA